MLDIGSKIKQIRKNRGMLQRELAEKAGVSRVAIVNYERGERVPNANILSKIANSLQVEARTLMSDDSFSKEILYTAIYLATPTIPPGSYDVFSFLEFWTGDYESLLDVWNGNYDVLPDSCIKGLLKYIAETSLIEFSKIYKELILTGIYSLSDDILKYAEQLNTEYEIRQKVEAMKVTPVSFQEMKSKVDSAFPTLDAEIKFLSDPNIEKAFNYSFNELAKQGGYQELLILAIEKAIKGTLNDIKVHLEADDLFDGVSSWISKESPLYEILKKNQKSNK